MRKDMVTRTVIGTKASVKVVNTQTDEISVIDVKLNKSFEAIDDKLMKAVRKVVDSSFVIIKIEAIEAMNKLYGLETAKFMEYAVELDATTRKPILTADNDED